MHSNKINSVSTRVLVFSVAIFSLLHNCNTSREEKSPVVATIDGREINLDEFRSFYNFDVNFGLDSSGYNALNDELLFYIDQIKARKKAEAEGLIRDSVFVKSYEWEKRQAILRQLYRQKISDNIEITDSETRNLYKKSQIQVRFRHLFFKSIDEARQAKLELSRGKSFKDMAVQVFQDDSLAKSGGELDWIKLSDLDDQLADSIFSLPLHTISHPLQSKWGYHLVEVIDKKENPLITEADYLNALPSLQKKIKMQKSRKLSLQYIYNYIGQLNPQLDPKMFMRLWNTIIPKDEKEKAVLSRSSELGQSEIKRLYGKLHNELTQPFIVYKEGFISLGDFLNGIEKVPLSHRFVFKSRRELANHIGRWVRDELLLAEAYRENLAAHERVINETNRFIEEQSYYFYQSQISDTMEIPSYVSAYFRQPQTFSQKTAFLRKYHTIQEWKFEYSKRQLHKILKDLKGELHINDDVLHQENKRVNWDNKIRMFMVHKPS